MKSLGFALLLLSLLIQGTAFASTEEAEKCLKKSVNEVITIASHAPNRVVLAESVRPVLENIISFDAMTRRSIGPGWRQFSTEQQKTAIPLYTTLIIRTYTAKFTPGELPVLTYKTALSPSPGRVEVPTNVLFKGNHYDVTYRLEDSGGWRITDVVIEGVSMIANYRTQFDAEFKQGGATAVISSLKRTVDAPQ